MNSRQIEAFRAILHYGTLTRAAEALKVSQSALSQIVLRTEDQVGPLFHRVKGRLIPTPLAERLAPEINRTHVQIERLRTLAAELKGGRAATVRINASVPLLMMLVPPLIRAIREAEVNIKVKVTVTQFPLIFERIASGHTDLGLTMAPAASPELHSEVVGSTAMVCVLPEDHRLAAKTVIGLADLAQEPLISYRADNEFGTVLDRAFAAEGHAYQPEIEIDASISSVIFVQQHLGIAVVEGASPWQSFIGVTTRPLVPRIPLPICFITSTQGHRSRSQEMVEHYLRRIIADHVPAGATPRQAPGP